MIIKEKFGGEIIGIIGVTNQRRNTLKSILGLSFNEFDFIKLFLAYMKKEGEIVIDIKNLADDLYSFSYCGFEMLFMDFLQKDDQFLLILQSAIQFAQEQSFLNTEENETESCIIMTEKQSETIIKQQDIVLCRRMEHLVKQYITHKKMQKRIRKDFQEEPEEEITLSRYLNRKEEQRQKDVQEMIRKDFLCDK